MAQAELTAVIDEREAETACGRTPSGGRSADAARAEAASAGESAAPPRASQRAKPASVRHGWYARLGHWLEEKISRLSTRNHFWHTVCSWIWLPLAYRSGIKLQKGSENTFTAVLPFRRFNRNWYKAMAGGALLGNAEVAGGMYVFSRCGGDYTVVCKELSYKFLRPCFGPAVYRIDPREDVEAKVAAGGEFNITIDMLVVQMVQARHEHERRVGQCTATFHVTPKSQVRQRKLRRRQKPGAAAASSH